VVARIAVLASARFAIRRPFAGGLEAQTYHLAQVLRSRGHEVMLYASADSDPALQVTPIVDRETRLQLSPAARSDPSMVAEPFLEEHHAYLSVMLRLADSDVDVVHNHSLHYLPVAMAPALGVPVVTTLHTPPTPWLESAMASLPAGSTNPTFVSVSDANARSWRCPDRIDSVIHNGIVVADWPFRAVPTGDHVVWTGRLVPEKAPHLAIDAARRAGREILLAGPLSDERYVAAEVVPRLGADARYVGHLDTSELAELVGSARVALVTPAWDEPYGLVVAEALACGTPVAAFRRGAMPELLDDETGVLAPPDDVDALATAIEAAAGLERGACRARAEAHCSIETMAARYEALYERLHRELAA
jgi:glycosyltransferase involved in cell wall biosynthesis